MPADSRGKADENYPLQVCIAHTFAAARRITVDGISVPTLPANIGHIVVIGDTGCRLKDDFVQDCNDPVKWPFAQVARLAAARHPDLSYMSATTTTGRHPVRHRGEAARAVRMVTTGLSGRRTFVTPPRRCWRSLLGSLRAAITSFAVAAATAGFTCSIRTPLRIRVSI